jgi:hypothetical protein
MATEQQLAYNLAKKLKIWDSVRVGELGVDEEGMAVKQEDVGLIITPSLTPTEDWGNETIWFDKSAWPVDIPLRQELQGNIDAFFVVWSQGRDKVLRFISDPSLTKVDVYREWGDPSEDVEDKLRVEVDEEEEEEEEVDWREPTEVDETIEGLYKQAKAATAAGRRRLYEQFLASSPEYTSGTTGEWGGQRAQEERFAPIESQFLAQKLTELMNVRDMKDFAVAERTAPQEKADILYPEGTREKWGRFEAEDPYIAQLGNFAQFLQGGAGEDVELREALSNIVNTAYARTGDQFTEGPLVNPYMEYEATEGLRPDSILPQREPFGEVDLHSLVRDYLGVGPNVAQVPARKLLTEAYLQGLPPLLRESGQNVMKLTMDRMQGENPRISLIDQFRMQGFI